MEVIQGKNFRQRNMPKHGQKGQRGQAAVTDALYFLLIITGLAVFLFAFANGYGNSVSQSLQRKYEVDFASSAMETLFNQSIPRNTHESIDNAREVDYLLAALKEDYADDLVLNDTNASLTNSIYSIMSPISKSRDYLFFLSRAPCISSDPANCKDFIYILLKTSVPCTTASATAAATCSELRLCSPQNGKLSVIQDLLIGLSNTSQSETKVIFIQKGTESGSDQSQIVKASLIMWPTTKLTDSAIDAMTCHAIPAPLPA